MTNVWSADSGMEVEDVWDDTDLIRMYEQSIQEQQVSGVKEKKYTGEDGKTYLWKVGGNCMAPFEENGETSYYAATIDSIGGKDEHEVQVTFLYYGNQTTAHMKDLWLNEEAIAEAVASEKKQKQKVGKKVKNEQGTNSSTPIPKMAPPIPPNILAMAPADKQEALSSMLMSWYMSGYHTGYYQAMSDLEEQGESSDD
ncbi:CRE-SMN-1 protein [Caenorhabditis remanei]|uniref:CRE-SMN-1 protein n=1 Tax=Caenorhabditis remanei TaxID=31234 RepID=E3MX09_CAERE|nr:CRE-SMN-1 protein [Caenorhabditis remanei]